MEYVILVVAAMIVVVSLAFALKALVPLMLAVGVAVAIYAIAPGLVERILSSFVEMAKRVWRLLKE